MLISYTVSEDVGSVDVCVQTTGLPSGGLAADLEVALVFMDSTKTSKFFLIIFIIACFVFRYQ